MAELIRILECLGDDLRGCHDCALLLVGFAGGFRRSELVRLNVNDVSKTTDGLLIQLRSSKSDPEGQGAIVALPYGSMAATCPVRSYRAWIEAAGISCGPVFRSVDRHGRVGERPMNGGSVARLIKCAAEAANLDHTHYSGHSLRAGFVTQAFLNGASEVAVMRQTRHHSLNTLRKYIRDRRSLFRDNPATRLGL